MKIDFRHFSSMVKPMHELMSEAAAFATLVGPDRLVSISHSYGAGDLFTVWYWTRPGDEPVDDAKADAAKVIGTA